MNEQTLNEIKRNYKERIDTKKRYQELIEHIKLLEENMYVIKYLSLCKEKEELEFSEKSLDKDDSEILESIINKYKRKIKETNGIYVYIGSYYTSIESDIVHGPSACRVKKGDEKAEYNIYKDIENEEEIEIMIDKCAEFENNNIVIFPNTHFTEEYYYEIQNEFFCDAVNTGQKEAVDKILKKVKKD